MVFVIHVLVKSKLKELKKISLILEKFQSVQEKSKLLPSEILEIFLPFSKSSKLFIKVIYKFNQREEKSLPETIDLSTFLSCAKKKCKILEKRKFLSKFVEVLRLRWDSTLKLLFQKLELNNKNSILVISDLETLELFP